jgi:two-component system chemotaxis response regulator CheV
MNSTPFAKSQDKAPLAAEGKYELLLFRLGDDAQTHQRELFGINVFKVREIVVAPHITRIVNAPEYTVGLADIRGQLIPVIDLPRVSGCIAQSNSGIVLVTEFARTTQAFLVDEVMEIVQIEWRHLLASDGAGAGLVSGIARLDGDAENSRLAQVLDVEQILRNVLPSTDMPLDDGKGSAEVSLPPGSEILFADDSAVARLIIEEGLKSMNVKFEVVKNGKEAWDRLGAMHTLAQSEGKLARDKVALVLTDLEMPEMDGFTLTRNIKQDPRFAGIPVIIYSSLTGTASEKHANSVGADAYVAKFEPKELREAIRNTMSSLRR